jgi:lysophospholipase L1-like esterase
VKDWKEAYPEMLEQELGARPGAGEVEVINAGVPGYGMAEILISLEYRVLDLQPDLIIVYENTNDVAARIVPPSSYRGDNGGRRRIWDSDTVSQMTSPIMRLPSALLRLLAVRLRWLGDGSSVSLDSVVDVPCTGHSAQASCLGMSVSQALEANPPIYFERHLRGLVALARAAGVKTLLLTWAHNPNMDDYASRPEMEAAFAQQNEIIARVAREEGTGFLDFAPLMPREKSLWADGRHMTAAGNKVRARLIADYLGGSGLL